MYRFNNNTIITGYIKQLLSSYNLPKFKILKKGTYLIPGETYLYKSNIYSYSPNSNSRNSLEAIIFEDDKMFNKDFKLLFSNYKENTAILNLTKTLEMKSGVYDPYTHNYLGNYLRWIRDYKGLDLMCMYNCFSTESPKNLKINLEKIKNVKVNIKTLDNYKIYMLPVKFNNQYTIGIDCDTSIELFCGIYANEVMLNGQLINQTYQKVGSPKLRRPFLYKKLLDVNPNISQLRDENNLKLFIKVPKDCKSSIVVLEGNYLDRCNYILNDDIQQIVPVGKLQYIEGKNCQLSANYISKLQLLQMSSHQNVPFSDRLVEYILGNVVTPIDSVPENIALLQNKLSRNKIYNVRLENIKHYGIWQESPTIELQDNGTISYKELRPCLYEIARKSNILNNKYDVLGYLDKDIEDIIGGIIE